MYLLGAKMTRSEMPVRVLNKPGREWTNVVVVSCRCRARAGASRPANIVETRGLRDGVGISSRRERQLLAEATHHRSDLPDDLRIIMVLHGLRKVGVFGVGMQDDHAIFEVAVGAQVLSVTAEDKIEGLLP
jgi:hypothetical protein